MNLFRERKVPIHTMTTASILLTQEKDLITSFMMLVGICGTSLFMLLVENLIHEFHENLSFRRILFHEKLIC